MDYRGRKDEGRREEIRGGSNRGIGRGRNRDSIFPSRAFRDMTRRHLTRLNISVTTTVV